MSGRTQLLRDELGIAHVVWLGRNSTLDAVPEDRNALADRSANATVALAEDHAGLVAADENSDRCAMFAGDTIRRAARFYVGTADPTLPLLSPLYGDFRGLPPMLVHASEDEVLRDDSIRVAEAARAAGVTVELQLWPHVPHVWQFFAAVLPEARASLAAVTRFIIART